MKIKDERDGRPSLIVGWHMQAIMPRHTAGCNLTVERTSVRGQAALYWFTQRSAAGKNKQKCHEQKDARFHYFKQVDIFMRFIRDFLFYPQNQVYNPATV